MKIAAHYRDRLAFTLVELLVVIAIIGVLVALLLPAVQQAREAARRMECTNNQKQIGLALHNYHDTHKVLPYNASDQLGNVGDRQRGCSWLVRIFPYLEQSAAYDQFVFAGDWSMQDGPSPNAAILDGLMVPMLNCPSSPLNKQEDQSTNANGTVRLQLVNYVGITGSFWKGGTVDVEATGPRVEYSSYGRSVFNGMIVSYRPDSPVIGLNAALDGTSNTMIVSEQSNYFYDIDNNEITRRSCGHAGRSWAQGGSAHTWTSNVTTIRYPIATTGGAGNTQNYHANIPLLSAHPGGVMITLSDGSVRFLPETVDFRIMTALADRKDKTAIGSY